MRGEGDCWIFPISSTVTCFAHSQYIIECWTFRRNTIFTIQQQVKKDLYSRWEGACICQRQEGIMIILWHTNRKPQCRLILIETLEVPSGGWWQRSHWVHTSHALEALLKHLSIIWAWIVCPAMVDILVLQTSFPTLSNLKNLDLVLHTLQAFSYKWQLCVIHVWSQNASLLMHPLTKQN